MCHPLMTLYDNWHFLVLYTIPLTWETTTLPESAPKVWKSIGEWNRFWVKNSSSFSVPSELNVHKAGVQGRVSSLKWGLKGHRPTLLQHFYGFCIAPICRLASQNWRPDLAAPQLCTLCEHAVLANLPIKLGGSARAVLLSGHGLMSRKRFTGWS